MLKDFLDYKEVIQAENDIEETIPAVLENETESIVDISFEIKQAFTKQFASEIAEQKVFMLIDSLSDLALRILSLFKIP